jgi:hypothetical protein
LEAVKRTTVQVTRQPLYPELHELGRDLLCQAWTDRGPRVLSCMSVSPITNQNPRPVI